MLSHVIPLCLVTDRIPIKLQLTGKSRLIFELCQNTLVNSCVFEFLTSVFDGHDDSECGSQWQSSGYSKYGQAV